eukprot:CAMPEP_0198252774 /NCGR_PEP_ID=MMETSP1447-20131203/3251_1 /TAXON_ID=420782 /ORGANISM="Chaetoceros dichaeta, Strain CCMP1751" /LENGTH=516 /DNA_ID=CAMNT_0043938157 /DNA_START=326 /DNA_END=1876 /DNA_ORIENTATION=+
MSTSGGSGKRGRDGQLKCSLSHSTYSESATRSASMESSDYDFSTTGGSCLLGPFSVASDYDDDDDDDDAYYANNSVLDKVVKGVGYDPDTNEKEEDTNVNQLMDSTTMTMIRRRETNDDDNGGIQPPPPHHHHHHHQQQQYRQQQRPPVVELVSEPILMEEDSAMLQQKISSSSNSSAVDNEKWSNTSNQETHHRCGNACCDSSNERGDIDEYGTIKGDGDDGHSKQGHPQTTTTHDTDGDGGAGSTPSLAASDQVVVLASHNKPVVGDHRDFRTIPDTITFTNNTNTNNNNQINNNTNDRDYQRKNLKYTSLKDLLRSDTAEQHQSPNDRICCSEDVVVVVMEEEEEEKCPAAVRIKGPISLTPMGFDGDTNVDDEVEADIPDECTAECHSPASGCILVHNDTLEQHTALITAPPPLPPKTTTSTSTTTTTTKMELGRSILDDDFYRKTNLRIPATNVVSSSEIKSNSIKDGGRGVGGGTMLLVSEVGLLEINPARLDLCGKRIDRRRECACIVM